MKKAGLLMTACLAVASLTGCGAGVAYFPAGAPLGDIYNGTTTSKVIGSGAVGSKHGEACGMSILGLITIGDSSAAAAAKAGGIATIGVIDVQDMNILGIYASHCTEAYGN
jgi:predicted small lipoprotein YifL